MPAFGPHHSDVAQTYVSLGHLALAEGDLMACAMADGTERFLTLDEHRNRWVEYTPGGLVAAAYDAVRVNRAAADGPARRRWRRAPAEDRSDWADAAR